MSKRMFFRVLGFIQWSAALVMLLGLGFSGKWLYAKGSSPVRFDVFLDDQRIGTVGDPGTVQRWKQRLYEDWEQQHGGLEVTSNMESLRFVPSISGIEPMDPEAVLSALREKLEMRVWAVELRVDGKVAGYMKDSLEALELLEQVKAPYVTKEKRVTALSAGPQDPVSAATRKSDADFVERVELIDAAIAPEQLETRESVWNRLMDGDRKPFAYKVVSGDCISLIAQRFGIPAEVIYRNNPQVKNDLIRVGEVLNLTVSEPLLSVRTTEQREETVKVPSGIVYEKDEELASGVIRIVSQGKPGVKQLIYETVKVNGVAVEERIAGEQLLEAPVQTVVRQGTKAVSGTGTGSFAVPVVHATVTSGFGMRWGTVHYGTDLVSDEKSILASDQGTVTFAGLKSGYGNCIVINHGNGFETLYGHLSKMDVRAGDRVRKGEKIGVMGQTGNATGVHLHFEIHKNGEQQNPMKYLQL
ncbi:M23 family metallopeptidase [Paenibacillus filicis]|uniref:M23 family metallopeptidase n=1 Tax=Paenibacillus gyeongsangnamensis TaxID=3388067 RepID=A0ABT4Q846_9BACL|nr:M23 family metallopeptidase [Paenibacillus filicis]MCZ8512999.1 M23 family metallopeptidase [Paenibacillus filicis]